MALVESTMNAIGTSMPKFSLPTTTEGTYNSDLETASKNGVLVAFISNHCPYVVHIEQQLAVVMNHASEQNLAALAIHSNDIESYPQDGPGLAEKRRQDIGYNIPFLTDSSQEIAKNFNAACTPDFFLYDGTKRLFYRGQFDSARPGNGLPVTGNDLRAAIDALLAGNPAPTPQIPSIGCNIKWRR